MKEKLKLLYRAKDNSNLYNRFDDVEVVIKQENEVEVILDLKKFNNLEEFWQKQLILYAIYLLFRNNARNRKKTYRRYSSPLSSKYRK